MIKNQNFPQPSSTPQWFSKTHWSKQFNETFCDWKLFIFKWPEYLLFALLYLADIVVTISIAFVVGIVLPLLTFLAVFFGIIYLLKYRKILNDKFAVQPWLDNAIKVTINAIYKLWCNFRGFLLDICNSMTSPIDSLANSTTVISLKLIGGIVVATLFTLGVIFSGGSVIPLAIVIKPFVLLMSPAVTFIANWVGLVAAQAILGYITITVGLLLGQKIVSWIGLLSGEEIGPSKFQVDTQNYPTILQTKLNGKYIQFREHSVAPNGDCGFTTLGQSREKVVTSLLALKGKAKAREFLREEIQNALITRCTGSEDKSQGWALDDEKANNEAKRLLEQSYHQRKVLDALIVEVKNNFFASETTGFRENELINFLESNRYYTHYIKQLKDSMSALLNAQQRWDNYCKSEPVFESYVQAYLGRMWLGFKSALLYAESANIALYIWRKDIQNPQELALVTSHIPRSPENIIHMLITQGFTHYNLLMVDQTQAVKDELHTTPDENAQVDEKKKPPAIVPASQPIAPLIVANSGILSSNSATTPPSQAPQPAAASPTKG